MDQSRDDVVASKTTPPDLAASPGPAQDDPLAKRQDSNARLPQEIVDVVLNFLSTSSNETLLGVLAFLALVTYVILGRVGLLLIGVALGVILHASWEGSNQQGDEGSRTPKKRRELALEVSQRLLDWPKRAASAAVDAEDEAGPVAAPEALAVTDLEYATFQPATAGALRSLTDAIVQDYVKYWYAPILPNESIFPGSCRRTLTHFVTAVSTHLARKRTEDTFLQFLTNSSSIIIVFLNELAAAFAAPGPLPTEADKIVKQYLENAPDSSLANVLSEEQQRKKLSMIADDILSSFLDPKAYSCSPVRDFLREVFAGIVLESTIISLSRPEFINDWIIYLLQDGESEIMHAIDAGVEGARNQGVSASKVSDDAKSVRPQSIKEEASSQSTGHQPSHPDKATEEAVLEAKRLSALIASQDVQSTSEPAIAQSGEGRPSTDHTVASVAHLANGSRDSEIAAPINPVQGRLSFTSTENQPSLPVSPSAQATPAPLPREDAPAPPLSLHGAQVMVDDDGAGSEKGLIKSRPTWDYLLQIEPASTRSTGWMVFRKYSDFQSLHEMLETVSRLNRIHTFSEQFPTLPPWQGKTRHVLARDLERYLQQAMRHESLAETDRMRRFLEKEGSSNEASSAKPGFTFPSQTAFENMGKGMLGALTNAPKGMAGGGRAVLDGVTGVFGGAGHSRKPTNTADWQTQHRKSPSQFSRGILSSSGSVNDLSGANSSPVGLRSGEDSTSSRMSEGKEHPALVSSPATSSLALSKNETHNPPSVSDSGSGINSIVSEQDVWASESTLALSEVRKSLESTGQGEGLELTESPNPLLSTPQHELESTQDTRSLSQDIRRQQRPITADETQIAVELIFAVINELYTLSSAWNIRRTLLNAAKTYILRPGSPTLETIRELLQDSMIEGHTSDNALGEYLTKLRENALPTEEELKAWPPPPCEQEKAQLRDKARRLFVQRGIPQALTSVMGAAASREALEKIFDSLQVETVARGFVFSVLLQGLRVLTL